MLLLRGSNLAMKTKHLIEYFQHPKLKETPDTFWKSKILITGLIILGAIGLCCLAYAVIGGIKELYIIAVPVLSVPFLLLAFRKTGALILFGNITTAVFAIPITPLPLSTGGIYSDDIIWLILAPVMAFTLTNLRSGFFWAFYVASVHAFYFYLSSTDLTPIVAPLAHWSPAFYYFSVTGLLMCILLLLAASRFGMNKLIEQLMIKQNQLNKKTTELEDKTMRLRAVEKTLRHSNHELEQFAYVVSHDLKAPLRGINSFSTLLDRHLKKTYELDEASQEYLDFIKAGTVNMNQLIEDIMNYSRAGTNKGGQENKVEMEVIQSLIGHNLRQQMMETDAEIHWQNIPTSVDLSKVQMLQLMQNLISNAIKYRKPNIPPVVIVNADEQETCWKFTIQDNGTGISEENIQKVFDLFIKLQGTNQEGSGVGLATCKKIVVNNGGEIWLESKVDVGSTFHFTILKSEYQELAINEKASEKSVTTPEASSVEKALAN